MLSKFFKSTGRVLCTAWGTAGALFDGFASTLSRAGYAQITARVGISVRQSIWLSADSEGHLGP